MTVSDYFLIYVTCLNERHDLKDNPTLVINALLQRLHYR